MVYWYQIRVNGTRISLAHVEGWEGRSRTRAAGRGDGLGGSGGAGAGARPGAYPPLQQVRILNALILYFPYLCATQRCATQTLVLGPWPWPRGLFTLSARLVDGAGAGRCRMPGAVSDQVLRVRPQLNPTRQGPGRRPGAECPAARRWRRQRSNVGGRRRPGGGRIPQSLPRGRFGGELPMRFYMETRTTGWNSERCQAATPDHRCDNGVRMVRPGQALTGGVPSGCELAEFRGVDKHGHGHTLRPPGARGSQGLGQGPTPLSAGVNPKLSHYYVPVFSSTLNSSTHTIVLGSVAMAARLVHPIRSPPGGLEMRLPIL